MTVNKIIPCICTKHAPNSGDSVHYGMPILLPYNTLKEHKQYYDVKCPVCGRGGLYEEKSPFYALQEWNKMQTRLYNQQNRKIIFYEPFNNYDDFD